MSEPRTLNSQQTSSKNSFIFPSLPGSTGWHALLYFSVYFSTLRADISAKVNPRGLKLILFESEGSYDSMEINFHPKGLKVKNYKGKQNYRSACKPVPPVKKNSKKASY